MSIVHTISRFKKDRFLRSLSEDEFRDLVARPLFLRLGFKDGRDLCGPSEAGKDAIFTERDKFGHLTVVALQTKKGNLNMGGRASDNICSAITQLQTALGTSIALLGEHRSVLPNKVYLCASGKINDAAKNHILSQVNNPNVTFLSVDELVPLVDEHIPEIWLGIEADIIPYFNAIRRIIAGDRASEKSVTEIFSKSATDENFVTLNLFRATSKTSKRHGVVSKEPRFEEFPLTAVLKKGGPRVLIVGEAGAGKSTGLQRIAYEAVSKKIEESGGYAIPILLRAIDIFASQPKNLVEYCHQTCHALTGSDKPTFTAADLQQGNLLLLVDSLDELPSDEARSYILDQLDTLQNAYPKTRIIITSRPHRYAGNLATTRRYAEFRISSISWRQAEKILAAAKRGEVMSPAQSQELLRKLETLHGIELNPLLVTVFAATTDVAKQDIPANITELFKKFTELMLGRWDEQKGLKQQFQHPLKDFVLTKLAYEMHARRVTLINRLDAERIVERELTTRGHEEDAERLLNEIFERSGLFRRYEDSIEFHHHLLQEFFAGRGIPSATDSKALVADEWWRRALVFYFGEHPHRIEDLDELRKCVFADATNLVDAAITIGLALQACYLSPVTEKLGVWRWVVHSLGVGREAYLKKIDLAATCPTMSFLFYCINSRDAVALSNLKAHRDELVTWASASVENGCDDSSDSRMFWLIIGLIESGEMESVEKLVESFDPSDVRMLFGIHVGCYLTAKVRPVGERDKKTATRICDRLQKSIAPYRDQLMRELGSSLVELRNGALTMTEET